MAGPAMSDTMTPVVPREGVQGIILRGYESLEEARFLLLYFPDHKIEACRNWLKSILSDIRNATVRPTGEDTAVNVAFTHKGLGNLGLEEVEPSGFSGFAREFVDGMDTKPEKEEDEPPTYRQRILGDLGSSEPAKWDWGKYDDPQPVNALLMLYAGKKDALDDLTEKHRKILGENGIAILRTLDTTDLLDRKEQFGFRDGIGQPHIIGVAKSPHPNNLINPGEILLGFPNAYNVCPVSPAVAGKNGTDLVNFGYGGSYLVFRQLRQDVLKFWQYLYDKTERTGVNQDERVKECIKLASKIVGRWPSGCPLAQSPEADNPSLKDEDDFGYQSADSNGTRVPIGAHVRRSNPRDSLEPGPGGKGRLSLEESRRVTLLHRMIRRGRPYGPAVHSSMEPAQILASKPDDQERGLHFICFNADIARQFEFVQQTWLNNPKFGGLYEDNDPIMGQRHPDRVDITDTFTLQSSPIRRRFRSLPEFVTVRGGAYFFMPGMEALKHLAGLPYNLPPSSREELGMPEDSPSTTASTPAAAKT
jgi:Dyp-type peroxidase family